LPERHPLASSKTISLAQLKSESWVMVSRGAAPAYRQQFDALCAQAKFRPRVVQESDRAAAILTMIAAEQGISLLPAALSRLIPKGVMFRDLPGKKVVLEHAFAYRAGAGPAVRDLVELVSHVRK
jgi:DNA-binding transcriptional LysR family regulator